MFTELFQTIYSHIWEFLLGLGLSAGVIYFMFNVIKNLIFIIFQKKKRALQKQLDNESIINGTANKVKELITPYYQEIKNNQTLILSQLDNIKTMLSNTNNEELESLSTEVKAYQAVMLSQDKNLQLQYEQIKSTLINASQKAKGVITDVAQTTTQIAENLTEAVVSNEENIVKSSEDVANIVKTVKNTAKKVKNKVKNVVYD